MLASTKFGQGARLQEAAFGVKRTVEAGHPRRGQDLQGVAGAPVHQVNRSQIGGDLRLGRPAQTIVDLVAQQVAGLLQKIKRHQPIRQAPDHVVAVRSDRRHVGKLVPQGKRLDRVETLGPAL